MELFTFSSLAECEIYRGKAVTDPECQGPMEDYNETKCFLSFEREMHRALNWRFIGFAAIGSLGVYFLFTAAVQSKGYRVNAISIFTMFALLLLAIVDIWIPNICGCRSAVLPDSEIVGCQNAAANWSKKTLVEISLRAFLIALD